MFWPLYIKLTVPVIHVKIKAPLQQLNQVWLILLVHLLQSNTEGEGHTTDGQRWTDGLSENRHRWTDSQ